MDERGRNEEMSLGEVGRANQVVKAGGGRAGPTRLKKRSFRSAGA